MTEENKQNLLLLAGSKIHGQKFFEFAQEWIDDHFKDKSKPILFIPYALKDHEKYANKYIRPNLPDGLTIESAHELDVEKLNHYRRCR